MIKPRFLPAAEADLLKEVAYYSKIRDGLGVKFEQAVESAVKKAVANPDGGAPLLKGTRRQLVQGFPFKSIGRAILKSSSPPSRIIEESLRIGQVA